MPASTTDEELLTLPKWREAVRARGQCERCPATEFLHAHHIDEDKTNNTLSNGECLCRDCHAEHHSKPMIVALDEAGRKAVDAKRGVPLTAHHRSLVGQPGSSNPFFGRTHTEAVKSQLREKAIRRYKDPAEREQIRKRQLERFRDPAARALMRIVNADRGGSKPCEPGCTCGKHARLTS